MKNIIYILLLFPFFSQGQYIKVKTVPCSLLPFKIITDTIFCVVPKNCNSFLLDSTLNGTWILFNEDSTTIRETFTINQSKLNGKYYCAYSNGKKAYLSHYKKGILDGYFESFYESGTVKETGFYSEGKETGRWYGYWENGQKSFETNYFNKKRNKNKYWDEKGIKISLSEYMKLVHPSD